jgi:hypothetical protein
MRPAYPEIRVGEHTVLVPHPVDGSVFILNAGGSFVQMNPRTGDLFVTATPGLLENEDPDGVMSPDGTRMVVNGPGRRVRLLDVDKQEYLSTDPSTPDSDIFDRLSAGQHRPSHRLHGRQDLDGGHANEHVGRPRVCDGPNETSPSRSGSSSFPISPTSRPAPNGRPGRDERGWATRAH